MSCARKVSLPLGVDLWVCSASAPAPVLAPRMDLVEPERFGVRRVSVEYETRPAERLTP